MESRQFDFYGVRAIVRSDDMDLLTELERDFRFFSRKHLSEDGSNKVQIELECRGETPPNELPYLTTNWINSRCTVYQDPASGEKWIWYYNGGALVHWNQKRDRGTIWSTKPEMLHELAYLLILSRIGERWDERGLHRLHAAALSWNHQALLLCLPSGGGKTTFAMQALKHPGLKLLSDDMPVIDRTGNVLAFPNRIGLCEEPALQIPRNFVRIFLRQEHGVKWLIDTEAFAGKVVPRALPGWIFVGARRLRGAPTILAISRWEAWKELFRSGVVGVGLPQVVELFLNTGWRDLIAKAKIAFSRSVAMYKLLIRSKTFRFELSTDREKNLSVFLHFLEMQTATQSEPAGVISPAQ